MITEFVKRRSGTAGELLENNALDKMVQRYGSIDVVKAIVDAELRSAGETWESLETYRRVKTKIQNDEISFIRAGKEAEADAANFVNESGMLTL